MRGAVLVGHSLGGQIALMVAYRAPETTGRVMVVDSPAFFGALIAPGGDARAVPALAEAARRSVLLLGDDRVRQAVTPWMKTLQRFSALAFLANFGNGSTGDRRVLSQGLYDVLTTDLRPELARVSQPVAVVYAWNTALRAERAEVDGFFRQSYRSLPHARFERVEPSGHMIMLDQPERLARSIQALLV